MKKEKKAKYIVGIDEVGRGPLAGPVTVGVCVLPVGFDRAFFKGLKDSKKLSPKKREEWCAKIEKEKIDGRLDFAVSSMSSQSIDSGGLARAISKAMSKSLFRLALNPMECFVFLDGGLKAPKEFIFQKTVIRGDEKIPAISLASIVAKVKRDGIMASFSKKYKGYGFEIHKGYGTKFHREKIKRLGPCKIHRISFLRNLPKRRFGIPLV